MSRPKEEMFQGNSRELCQYLQRISRQIKNAIPQVQGKERKILLRQYGEMLDDILALDCFHYGSLLSMKELLEVLQRDYGNIKTEEKKAKEHLEKCHKHAEEMFERIGKRMATQFDDDYLSPEQMEFRELKDKYDYAKYVAEHEEQMKKCLWWLMGIIHRPKEFFSKLEL